MKTETFLRSVEKALRNCEGEIEKLYTMVDPWYKLEFSYENEERERRERYDKTERKIEI